MKAKKKKKRGYNMRHSANWKAISRLAGTCKMKKLLEVREYDRICCNPAYASEYAYLPEKVFRELEEFIHTSAGDETNADALEFMKISYSRNVGDVISLRSYVGLIEMQNGYQIQILPKIDLGDRQDDSETKRIFLRMLRSMKDFPGRAFNDASLKLERMPLYEMAFFISDYLPLYLSCPFSSVPACMQKKAP